jgi:predicted secreted protein
MDQPVSQELLELREFKEFVRATANKLDGVLTSNLPNEVKFYTVGIFIAEIGFIAAAKAGESQ